MLFSLDETSFGTLHAWRFTSTDVLWIRLTNYRDTQHQPLNMMLEVDESRNEKNWGSLPC